MKFLMAPLMALESEASERVEVPVFRRAMERPSIPVVSSVSVFEWLLRTDPPLMVKRASLPAMKVDPVARPAAARKFPVMS